MMLSKRIVLMLVILLLMPSSAGAMPIGKARADSDCIDIAWLTPISTYLNDTNDRVDEIVAIVSGKSTAVTISNNPFSILAGFMALMSQIAWLTALFVWFNAAIVIILVLQAIRLLYSVWPGIIEKVLQIFKSLPFIN